MVAPVNTKHRFVKSLSVAINIPISPFSSCHQVRWFVISATTKKSKQNKPTNKQKETRQNLYKDEQPAWSAITSILMPDDDVAEIVKKSFEKRDYNGIIDRLIGRIQSLTQTRMDMMSKSIDIELKQYELAKIQDEEGNQKAQPIPVVVNVVDGRKDAETK